MARRKKRRAAAAPRRRRRRAHAVNPRRRRRRRIIHRANAVTRRRRRRRHVSRRRSYRRNPGIGGGGIVRTVVQGAKDGFAVTLGQGVTNLIAQKIPFGQSSPVGQGAMQLLVGTATSMLVKKFAGERFAAFYLAGAYSNVIRKALAPVPVLGPALSGVGVYAAVPRMGTYARIATPMNGYSADEPAVIESSGTGRSVLFMQDDTYMM